MTTSMLHRLDGQPPLSKSFFPSAFTDNSCPTFSPQLLKGVVWGTQKSQRGTPNLFFSFFLERFLIDFFAAGPARDEAFRSVDPLSDAAKRPCVRTSTPLYSRGRRISCTGK